MGLLPCCPGLVFRLLSKASIRVKLYSRLKPAPDRFLRQQLLPLHSLLNTGKLMSLYW